MTGQVRVFIAGSRALSRLNEAVRQRLDRIVDQRFSVLLGDANGADKAVQRYLAELHYDNVTVYCTGSECRNNLRHWPTKMVAPPAGVRSGFDYYAAKDRAMAADASHGLMIWDAESRGTFASVANLIDQGKPVVVYLSPTRSFRTLHARSDLMGLLEEARPSARSRLAPLVESIKAKPLWRAASAVLF